MRRRSASITCGECWRITDSVISSSSVPGVIPVRASTPWMRRTRSGCTNCRGERFTAIRSASHPGRDCHRASVVHASSSTARPMGRMRPVSSARGMKSSGRIRPRPGCVHRARASKPVMRPVSSRTIGW